MTIPTSADGTFRPRPGTPADEAAAVADDVLLDVRGLSMDFPVRGRGMFARTTAHVHAVSQVDLTIRSGEVLGLVGESGCGKTTLGQCLVGAIRPTGGAILFREPTGNVVDLAGLDAKELRQYQRDVRLVFQDPFSCLNPRLNVLQIVGDPLKAHGIAKGSELEERVADTLRRVGLSAGHMHRFPHAFSGGERQRINIARALIMNPRLVIADEAVSALDVSIRAQIINLLRDLQDEYDLTYLFISHDLSVIESMCDRVAVMYLGKVVEVADTAEIYQAPKHPYTEALLSAVPRPDPRLRGTGRRIRLPDDFPDPTNPPPGCYFNTRCPHVDVHRCRDEAPPLRMIADQHHAACHFADTLNLAGVSSPGDSATADS